MRSLLLASLLVSIALATSGCGNERGTSSPSPAALPALHATRGDQPGIFDALGRQVILRGMNLNSLGDYYKASPQLPEVYPFDASYFAEMQGFNVVRLIVSWSALEPERGRIDSDYIARIHAAVDAARANRIYVVLDMHQDAWGKYIASPPGTICADSDEPAIGWDGAPEWATYTDGASTCRNPGFRESAPAVVNAFANFYADRDGIQTELVHTWAALAGELAQDTTVAGYDLINEPHYVTIGRHETATDLGAFYARAIAAIRAAEENAGGFAHIVFFEPLIHFPLTDSTPPLDFTTDTNLVFAPHNYAESINSFFSIEQQFINIKRWADRYHTTFWIGEYGWFGDPPTNESRVARYAAQEDLYRIGGTWWQWLQACGDPHTLSGAVASGDFMPGPEAAPPDQILYHRILCPSGDVEPIPEWAHVLTRPWPIAAPGRLLTLSSDSDEATLQLTGDAGGADPLARLELWVPERGLGTPRLSGAGIGAVQLEAVAGGHRVLAEVSGNYDASLTYIGPS